MQVDIRHKNTGAIINCKSIMFIASLEHFITLERIDGSEIEFLTDEYQLQFIHLEDHEYP